MLTWRTKVIGFKMGEQGKQSFPLMCNVNLTKTEHLSKPTVPWMNISRGFLVDAKSVIV